MPFPLPAVGAKVKITGAYNVAKTVVSDMVSEPTGGVMALQKVDTLAACARAGEVREAHPLTPASGIQIEEVDRPR